MTVSEEYNLIRITIALVCVDTAVLAGRGFVMTAVCTRDALIMTFAAETIIGVGHACFRGGSPVPPTLVERQIIL